MAKHSEIDLDRQAGARSSKMDQKTIPDDGQKDVLQFLLKLAQFTEPLAKTYPYFSQ